MARRRRSAEAEQRLATELRASRTEPDEWDETPVQASVARERNVLMSFRISASEVIALQRAARQGGESLSEFIRKAIGLRLYGKPVINAVQIASGLHQGSIQTTMVVPTLRSGHSENPLQKGPDPDQVPRFANIIVGSE